MEDALLRLIKSKRKELGLKQSDLAKALHIQVATYSKVELGLIRMTDDKLLIIAKKLQTTPHQLKLESSANAEGALSLGQSTVELREYMLLLEKYTKVQEDLIQALQAVEKQKN